MNKSMRVMDRTITYMMELPEGYKCNDVTMQFILYEKNGLKLSPRHKWGIKFVGEHTIGGTGMLRSIMKAMEEGKKGFLILAIDRVYKELMYVCL